MQINAINSECMCVSEREREIERSETKRRNGESIIKLFINKGTCLIRIR